MVAQRAVFVAMTAPPFVFNHRTGELSREGKLIALCQLHADIFNCFAHAQTPIGCGAIARAINMPVHAIENELPALLRRLKRLGIGLAVVRNGNQGTGGRYLVFEDVPKWKPTIAPPATMPGETR